MSAIRPVPFATPRAAEPRLSAPYVPGKHHERFWTPEEDAIIRQYYPTGGMFACQAKLPAHHSSRAAIYQRARKLGLERKGVARPKPIVVSDDFDERLRAAWSELDGRKRGEVAALADRFGVPRWWLTGRATALGLTIPHKKEPPWTAAETELMKTVPLHRPDRCAEIFRAHGFNRSPTAIMVRAKRLSLSRRATREELSACQAAQILGVDVKSVTASCIAGDLVAKKRDDRRLVQQGGKTWDIRPADLRRFIIDHLDRIDIRKVEKFAFVALLTGEGAGAD